MSEIHVLDKGVYAVTNLYHPVASVNAGFIITKNFVAHVDAGMTAMDGEYLLRASTEKLGKSPKKYGSF